MSFLLPISKNPIDAYVVQINKGLFVIVYHGERLALPHPCKPLLLLFCLHIQCSCTHQDTYYFLLLMHQYAGSTQALFSNCKLLCANAASELATIDKTSLGEMWKSGLLQAAGSKLTLPPLAHRDISYQLSLIHI